MGQADPRAALAGDKLLAAATPVLKLLGEDLLARAKASPAVTAALQARHAAEHAARRTADPFLVWQQSFVDQVAAAWLLSCVFVRTLEDRGLIAQARLAGPGALDSQRLFFDMAPSLTERDYLLTVFRELSRFPAARDLFDTKHNPVWLLTPSAAAAKALLGLFREPTADTPAFRFGQADTRFLGDLYQDLNEAVQKRYALLQTPRFVESFILDRTLERAVETFGLDETTLIDPTCGSGHFLLGAFDRLFDHRLRSEPGLGPREAARKALDAVYGSDINPYAIAIARFRLTLAYLEKAGFTRLADAPALPLHLVVADSLLHNAQVEQKSFLELEGQSAGTWGGVEMALEDEAAAREVLHRRYAAVVGNPPYITVKDAVLRDRYRELYPSCHREYSVAVPFTERFFQLARPQGRVGMITANSFMKREFGKKLIEEYLPTVDLDLIVNTSGAYIPGHGTPTVLLFGASRARQGIDVLSVLAKRGEPATPAEPEQGEVWRSIAENWDRLGFENEFISVSRFPGETLSRHPWSLGGGGASELKELLEGRATTRLGDLVSSIGFMCITKQDDVFAQPPGAFERRGIPGTWLRQFVVGENCRDWSISEDQTVFFPYQQNGSLLPLSDADGSLQALWPYRAVLEARAVFGGETFREAGRPWHEFGQIPKDRIAGPAIGFAFVATHNHFVLDRGGKVFNRTAPIIKLPESATEDDHLALLAYLNSSTACFWMKQVFFPKTSGTNIGDVRGQEHRIAYEFAGTGLRDLPLPQLDQRLARLGREMCDLADQRATLAPAKVLAEPSDSLESLRARVAAAASHDSLLFQQMVARQETIDWHVYQLFGLAPASCSADDGEGRAQRADERAFLGAGRGDDPQSAKGMLGRQLPLALIEDRLCKRPWFGVQGVFHRDGWTYEERVAAEGEEVVERLLEHTFLATEIASRRQVVVSALGGTGGGAIWDYVAGVRGTPAEQLAGDRLAAEAVPYLAASRHSEDGLDKLASWEATWDLQRREDAGESVGEIPVPPKYDVKDFRDPNFFRLRGKLDVPKERFISYPGCESDQDGEPVYGWAGWNHLQRAQALSALYQKRKTEEAWSKERLTPMLAGILELLPWIKQWHNAPSEDFDVPAGDFFEAYLDGECRSLGLTHDDLRAWRPAAKGRAAKAARAAPAPDADEDAASPAPKKTRKPRKAKPEASADES